MRFLSDPCGRQLNLEWAEVRESAVPAEWLAVLGVAEGATLASVLDGIRADPDVRLGALLRLHAAGDRLAGRVVLQAMLGKLILLAAEDSQHGLGDYVAECWLRLSSYPLARRPRRIAANLALDTRRAVRAADRVRHELALELPVPPTADQGVPGVLRAATRLGLLDREAAACLFAVYGLGLRSHEAAVHFRISPELVRWRNARSIRRLVPHASALAAFV